MKTLNITFTDKEFLRLKRKKDTQRGWRENILRWALHYRLEKGVNK